MCGSIVRNRDIGRVHGDLRRAYIEALKQERIAGTGETDAESQELGDLNLISTQDSTSFMAPTTQILQAGDPTEHIRLVSSEILRPPGASGGRHISEDQKDAMELIK